MTPDEITSALAAAGIPNPACRYDDNGGRYRVTAETEHNGRHCSFSAMVYLYVDENGLKDVIESFRLWHNELTGQSN